jgi:hypothetical protein
MTPERLDEMEAAAKQDGILLQSWAEELIAEIRRLWPVLEAAKEWREAKAHIEWVALNWSAAKVRHAEARYLMAMAGMEAALSAYDSAADQHPGQMSLGGEGR